jgi:hypothetical protein
MRWGDSCAIEDAMNNMETEDRVPAKTTTERVAALRQRRLEAGQTEVRGIFAHADDHAAIKEHAAKLAKRRERAMRKAPTPKENS